MYVVWLVLKVQIRMLKIIPIDKQRDDQSLHDFGYHTQYPNQPSYTWVFRPAWFGETLFNAILMYITRNGGDDCTLFTKGRDDIYLSGMRDPVSSE